jgi:hypothetical protein
MAGAVRSFGVGCSSRELLAIVVLAGCLGCGPGTPPTPPRVALSGQVKYNSEPVSKGLLLLQPKGQGQPVSTSIADGKYAFTKADGPIAGAYHATITRTGAEETAPINRGFGGPGGRNFPPPKRPVDRAGQKNSFELDIDVAAGESGVRDIELKD